MYCLFCRCKTYKAWRLDPMRRLQLVTMQCNLLQRLATAHGGATSQESSGTGDRQPMRGPNPGTIIPVAQCQPVARAPAIAELSQTKTSLQVAFKAPKPPGCTSLRSDNGMPDHLPPDPRHTKQQEGMLSKKGELELPASTRHALRSLMAWHFSGPWRYKGCPSLQKEAAR